MDRKSYLVRLAVISLLCIPFFGCNSDHTSRSGSSDLNSVYVAGNDDNGSIDLVVDNATVQVGDTTGFIVSVLGRNSQPISDMRVACDSEKGIAIVEPNTGFEMTNASGKVSGVIGCEYAGSFRFGCRLPVGVNKRKFISVRCEGLGSSSWPNAAGGGLGGGAQGTDIDGDIRVSEISFRDAGIEGPTQIDIVPNRCTQDGAACSSGEGCIYSEVFTPAQVRFKFVNDSSLAINLTSMSYVLDGVPSSNIAINFRIEGNDPNFESDWTPFLEVANGKRIYGQSSILDKYGIVNVTFTLTGINSAGENVSLSASSSVNLDYVNNCQAVNVNNDN